VNSAFLKLPLHDLIWMASEVSAISDSHFQHIYNYVCNSTLKKWAINNYVAYKKMFLHVGKNGKS